MTAMFPDSGVPPSDAKNSIPDPATQNCSELWYSTSRCQPRFDPAAANAMLAEQINLINKGEVVYDCNSLEQVQLSTRYLIQRGLPKGGIAQGGPSAYALALDPTLTRYNDYLHLVVVPAVNNVNGVTLNIDGKGAVQVLRWDRQQLKSNDWIAGVPVALAYYAGYFWMMRAADSQLLKPMTASIEGWIRTDGNDATGDGTENSAAKAFRTIQGAWGAIMARSQLPSTVYSINLRLGIPGIYEPAALGPYGGTVNLYGDVANRNSYIITQSQAIRAAIWTNAINMNIIGVTMEITQAPAWSHCLIASSNSNVTVQDCVFHCRANNVEGSFIAISFASTFASSSMEFRGNGNTLWGGIMVGRQSQFNGLWPHTPYSIDVTNANWTWGFITAEMLSAVQFEQGNIWGTNVTGPQYKINTNSIVMALGKTMPGNAPGTVNTGGQFLP